MAAASGTIGATHTIVGWAGYGGNAADAIKITEAVGGVRTFTVGGVSIGTYTPSGTQHIEIIVSKFAAGVYESSWASGDRIWVTVLIDKVITYNVQITATANGAPNYGVPILGETAGIGGAATIDIDHMAWGYTDRANPIGKIAVGQWAWRLGVTPPTGYDEGAKSTGADGAAVVDETPPGGTGTTDGDYYDFVDDGSTVDNQVNALAQNILSAGDVLYAVGLKAWARTATSSKLTAIGGQLHDGTTASPIAGSTLTGPTSYAETIFGNPGQAVWNTAPDSAAFSGKANAYLNGMFAGTYQSNITLNANMRVDALLVETAIVLSGDAISAIADPTLDESLPVAPALMGLSPGII
jgi:hypothetical protein